MCLLCLFVAKCGRTQSLLTGSTFRGEALKGRSEGCWRSGRRRSGDVGGGGTVNDYVIPCRAAVLLSTHCARNLVAHSDLALESDGFLVIRVDGDGAQRVLPRFAPVASFEKDFAEQDVRVD
jgi:hypothetical protein